jgi:hypothetical protein
MSPKFTRDIQRTLLENIKNLHIDLLLRGYHPLWRDFPVNFEYFNLGVNESITPHFPYISVWDSVCPIPRSIAFTDGISVDFFSCGY